MTVNSETLNFLGADDVHAFEELLKPYGIKEAVRTGRVALRKTQIDRTRGRRMHVLA